MVQDSVCVSFVSPRPDASVLVYDLAIGLPAFAFLLALAWGLKSSLRKLRRSQSRVMATYYGFLWALSLLNLLRCIIQLTHSGHAHPVAWNILWLATRFGMVLLEVSVVVFLMQGYQSSGKQALLSTLWTSGVLSGIETLVKALYIFLLHIPLFLYWGDGDDGVEADMRWSKWSFWLLHTLVFSTVYLALLLLPMTQWRDALPAKPAFYRYLQVLLLLNVTCVVGAVLIGSHVVAGYCVYGAATWLYYALYPPLVYVTFLAEFFADEQLDLDLMYYSEMREAGFLELEGGDEEGGYY